MDQGRRLVGTIGITDYAQQELGDVVFVELPKVGAQIKSGESFGTVESVKAVSDIFTPVSGEITEINSLLVRLSGESQPGSARIRMAREDAPHGSERSHPLMDAAAYETYIAEQTKEHSA